MSGWPVYFRRQRLNTPRYQVEQLGVDPMRYWDITRPRIMYSYIDWSFTKGFVSVPSLLTLTEAVELSNDQWLVRWLTSLGIPCPANVHFSDWFSWHETVADLRWPGLRWPVVHFKLHTWFGRCWWSCLTYAFWVPPPFPVPVSGSMNSIPETTFSLGWSS